LVRMRSPVQSRSWAPKKGIKMQEVVHGEEEV
jgi:hypothetical protein